MLTLQFNNGTRLMDIVDATGQVVSSVPILEAQKERERLHREMSAAAGLQTRTVEANRVKSHSQADREHMREMRLNYTGRKY